MHWRVGSLSHDNAPTSSFLEQQPRGLSASTHKRSQIQNLYYRHCWWTIHSHHVPMIRNNSIIARILCYVIKYVTCRFLVDAASPPNSQNSTQEVKKLQRKASSTGNRVIVMLAGKEDTSPPSVYSCVKPLEEAPVVCTEQDVVHAGQNGGTGMKGRATLGRCPQLRPWLETIVKRICPSML